ncbi:MAG TPA: DUF507 family protein [Terriglobia bacterium]|nr:DUF507 family protein [Terriglobia bacterium]
MKLTHEKVTQLSHRMLKAIETIDEVEIFEEPNVIRLEIVKILNDLLREEEKVDQSVRLQITSQKRTIPEGSGEWEILYRKYYADALRKLGVTFSSPDTRR